MTRKVIPPIESDNLSLAWAKAFIEAINSPGGVLSRLIVTIRIPECGVAAETPEIRAIIDDDLVKEGKGL